MSNFARALCLAMARFTNRRLAVGRAFNKRFAFSLAVLSVLSSKIIHIHTHVTALSRVHLLRWGYSFFAQDLWMLIAIRLLVDGWVASAAWPVRIMAGTAAYVLLSFVIGLGIVNVSFFVVSGSEIRWANVGLAGDPAWWGLMLSGLLSLSIVAGCGLVAGWFLQETFFALFGFGTDLIRWPVLAVLRRAPAPILRWLSANPRYEPLPDTETQEKIWLTREDDEDDSAPLTLATIRANLQISKWRRWVKPTVYLVIGVALAAEVVMFTIRPHESSLIFMSWTSALLPFVDFSNSSPNLAKLKSVYGTNIGYSWDNHTAVVGPNTPDSLPVNVAKDLSFWQRYLFEKHYDADYDPLKISNSNESVLPDLKKILTDLPIRHVAIVFLESTRQDMFPLKKDGLIWRKLAETWDDKKLPKEAEARLTKMTPTANWITGDYDDGFERSKEEPKPRRGGINFKNARTSATYTLKSVLASLCGIEPITADFNLESMHKLDQPCLPHILDLLNHMSEPESSKWRPWFMQSVTMEFDKEGELLQYIGYPEESLINKEYLRGDKGHVPKFGRVTLPDVNYFGVVETPLMDYMHDAFKQARENNERLLFTHLTSTTHHPFGLPDMDKYVPVGKGVEDFSRWVNAIAYDDEWLGKVMGMLEDEGVANETLVVLMGDHGLSMPENNVVASYYNPNVGSDNVPLVISHPLLPVMDIDEPVMATQILPTILDLLIETESLPGKQQQTLAGDLMRNYHGQSLIRKQVKSTPDGQGDWQFTNINPGRAMVAVRDGRHPDFRLIVPVIDNIEWRFTDTSKDPAEKSPVLAFDFEHFLRSVEDKHGLEAAQWAEEAAFVTRWWVEENGKRWRYGPYRDGV